MLFYVNLMIIKTSPAWDVGEDVGAEGRVARAVHVHYHVHTVLVGPNFINIIFH